MITSILKDPISYMYFHFLSTVVLEFEKVDELFQSTIADPEDMVQLLFRPHKSLPERLYGCSRRHPSAIVTH